jgi:pyruvate dehydrogenase E1 component beta subunit
VIGVRTLNPDHMGNIAASARKAGRVVGLTESHSISSSISGLATRVQDEVSDWLHAPIVRVCTADVPHPRSNRLEDDGIPNLPSIIASVR